MQAATDVVLAEGPDRLGSNRYEIARSLWRLRNAGVRLLFTNATDPMDEEGDRSGWNELIGYYEELIQRMRLQYHSQWR